MLPKLGYARVRTAPISVVSSIIGTIDAHRMEVYMEEILG